MKRCLALSLLALLVSFAAIAQTAPAASAASSLPEVKLFSIETGVLVGYDLGTSDTAGGTSFGLNLVVADNVTVGFQTARIGAGYNTLKMSYYLTPAVGLNANIGTDGTNTAAALGAFFNIGRGNSANGLASAYRIKADYFFPTTDIAAGVFAVSLALALGL